MDTELTDELLAELDADEARLAASPATGDRLDQLRRLADEHNNLTKQIEDLEARVKASKQRRWKLETDEMLAAIGNVEQITVDGRVFRPEMTYHASIPKDRNDEACDWLIADGSGDIVKFQVVANFPRDSEDLAKELVEYIERKYSKVDVEVKRGVPWARLTSWLKERMTSNDPFIIKKGTPPLELLGALVARRVIVKNGK